MLYHLSEYLFSMLHHLTESQFIFFFKYLYIYFQCDRMAADCAYELREHHVISSLNIYLFIFSVIAWLQIVPMSCGSTM